MSLSGSSNEITSNTSLTSNALIKGSDGNTVRSTGILCDDSNRLTGVDEINCGTLNATFNVNGGDGYFTVLDTERLRLQDGTNDIIMKAPSSTGSTIVKYGEHTENVVHTLPNVTGTVAISGGSQNVSFGTITTPSITSSSSLSITSGTNQNINLDAQGTGLVNLNTVQSFGVSVNTNSTTNLGFAVRNASQPFLAMGYLVASSEVQPTIASMAGTGLAYHNMTLRDKVLVSNTGFTYAYLSDCLLGVGGNIKCSGAIKTDSITPQSSTNTITVPNVVGTMVVTGANQNVSFGNITSSTNSLNGIIIPSSGGTLAKTSDIPSPGLNLVVAQILSDGTIFYQAGSRTVSVSVGGTGVYVLTLSSGALIRSCVGSCTQSGAMRTLNCEVNGTNSCTVVCRDKVEAGIDSPFNVHITWT